MSDVLSFHPVGNSCSVYATTTWTGTAVSAPSQNMQLPEVTGPMTIRVNNETSGKILWFLANRKVSAPTANSIPSPASGTPAYYQGITMQAGTVETFTVEMDASATFWCVAATPGIVEVSFSDPYAL